MPPRRLLVLTDLDGTLLDAATYSWEGAADALTALQRQGGLVVPVSSKTRAEIEAIRVGLKHHGPFIVENGGAVLVPRGTLATPIPGAIDQDGYHVLVLGRPYPVVRQTLKELGSALGVSLIGFGDLSVAEIGRLTGLPFDEAARAKQREYDEPFFSSDPHLSLDRLKEAAGARGFQCIAGGRFHHLLAGTDKGVAARRLIDAYRREARAGGPPIVTVGVGDSLNDLPLLSVVDYPILVQRPDGSYDPAVHVPRLHRAGGIGPAGWNSALLSLLATA
ncbi:HAD-IIB family hydrolase [Candidatus Nitrospira bockiana]